MSQNFLKFFLVKRFMSKTVIKIFSYYVGLQQDKYSQQNQRFILKHRTRQ